ncbi:MAG: hypothetical protein RLZZ282_118 [Verrucomicrobiota bacterium]|jgi:hypothetical protein
MISLGRLERRLGGLSFPGFLRYYAMMHALVYMLQWVRPDIGELLEFDRSKIFAGEIWRVLTFLFASSGTGGIGGLGLMMMVFLVMIASMMSAALEDAWGAFKTTLFHAVGILALIMANFFLPEVLPGSGFLLYSASFFAFATLFPKVEFLLFFIFPVQVRFLAWIQAAVLALTVATHIGLTPYFLLGYANFLIFAGIPAMRGTAAGQKRRLARESGPVDEAFHTCRACDRTDVTHRELDFRVDRDGHEYCQDHLPE